MTGDDMDQLLSLVEARLGRSWVDVVAYLRSKNGLDIIEARLRAGDISGVLQGIEDAASSFAADVHAAYALSAQKQAAWVDGQVDSLVRFDQTNRRAVAWAQQNQYDLVRGLTQESRDVVRQVIADGLSAGQNPRQTAVALRESLGLTPYQAQQVASYRRALESGDYDNALSRQLSDGRSDRTIATAGRAGRPLTPDQVDTAVERYRAGWTAFRAETVARTEAQRALHQGADEAIRQAVQQGAVSHDDVERTWVTAKDKRVRDSHRVMAGQKRGIGEMFEDGDGNKLAYPGDPAAPIGTTVCCRCVLATRVR